MSFDIKHRANNTIAQGALTNSKHPDRFVSNVPSHVKYGFKAHLVDMENRKWLDMICGLGANHFGYGNQKIQREVIRYAFHGGCHSLPTYHEVEATEKLKQLYYFVEKVKWVNDGSSACTASCIIARAYTGRSKILTEGYHGWHPEHISTVADKPDGNIYNIKKYESLEDLDSTIAAFIIEPVQLDNSPERIKWLHKVRELCAKHGIVLIFDEVITGIRYNEFGVCNHHRVEPDLLLLGKAIGNGEKIACVCGKKDLMDGSYFVSGTYHGQIQALITAKTAMHLAKFDPSYDLIKLNSDSLDFYDKLNNIAEGLFCIKGWGCRGAFEGDYALFFQEMAKARILFGPSIFINFESVKILNELLQYAQIAIDNIKKGDVKLIGNAPTGAFSSKMRGKKDD